MMRSRYGLLCLLVIFVLASCGGSGLNTTPMAASAGEKLVATSHDKRPAWTYREPGNEKGTFFFVGLSGKYATEKLGREDAQRSSITNVVRFMGTTVKDNFQRLTTAHGLSSDIVDPTVATRRFEQQLNNAMARRVKVKEYYIEQWENKLKERYFVAFALSTVPQKSIDQVYEATIDGEIAQLKKKRDAANNAKAKKQFTDAMKAFEEAKKQGFSSTE
ncbi:MAG: hypothetical protein KAS70_01095 [Planctomycetes bacterium]|nr:hypothetical protein [Planctomycetota bacterium]